MSRFAGSSSAVTASTAPAHKIRVTVLCARSLAKRELFRLPDPFVRITVDPGPANPAISGQSCVAQTHCTETARNTIDPKWNAYYDLLLRPCDAITISIWNERKVHKKKPGTGSASGFLGCVRLLSNAIERLKDTGYQRLDLVSDNNNPLPVKGQIVISLLSRDGHGTGKRQRKLTQLLIINARSVWVQFNIHGLFAQRAMTFAHYHQCAVA